MVNESQFKISVVIPVYNSEKTIKNTLESVINQSYLPYEVVLVNDGSTDNSRKIIDDFVDSNTFKNVNFKLINKSNGGVSTARNTGLKIADGDWIAFLDSDDKWLPNKLEFQKKILEQNPNIDFLGCTRNGEIIKSILWKQLGYLTKITAKNLLVRFVFVVPTIIFKKSIIKQVGFFDENQKYAEEGNYFIRIANKYNCYLLNECLVITGNGKAHFGESGLSGNIKEMEKGELKNIKDSLHLGVINKLEYYMIITFSLLKYLRRVLIVKYMR